MSNTVFADLTFNTNVLTLSLADSAEAMTRAGRLFQSPIVLGIVLFYSIRFWHM